MALRRGPPLKTGDLPEQFDKPVMKDVEFHQRCDVEKGQIPETELPPRPVAVVFREDHKIIADLEKEKAKWYKALQALKIIAEMPGAAGTIAKSTLKSLDDPLV